MKEKILSTLIISSCITGLTVATDVGLALDASILQSESAKANQRIVDRASAPVQLTAYSSQTSMTPLPKEDPSFEIHHIVVTSKDSHFRYLRHALSAYENQQIGQQGIEMLTKQLQERVINDGYVTSRVVVPNQDMTSGTLTFEIEPGYIEDIKLKDPTARGNWRVAFPTRSHELVKRQNLEQGVDQMKSVPRQHIKIALEPGSTDSSSLVVFGGELQ